MEYNFDERLAYVEEGEEVTAYTRDGEDFSFRVADKQVNYSPEGLVDEVILTPEDLEAHGRKFSYSRHGQNPQKVEDFQAANMIDYVLEDRSDGPTDEAYKAAQELFGWRQNSEKRLLKARD
ncbi:MAG: hypothetical protein ABEK16_02265 [Candidatus Nanohalobium sp.]